jgi:hypothetical protein
MKKTDTHIKTPTKKKDELYQETQWSPQKQSERRNPGSNQWGFHTDVTRNGQTKRTGGSQVIPWLEYEKKKQVNYLIGALNKHQSEEENARNREIHELR